MFLKGEFIKENKMSQENLIQRLLKVNPKRNIVFIAIEELKTPEQIRTFYKEYVEYLRKEGDEEVRNNAEEIANKNTGYVIVYVIVYYGEEISEKWKSILEQINHPVFGRKNPFKSPAVESYLRGSMDAECRLDNTKILERRSYLRR